MTNRIIRILCVDDHAFLIDGLQARFELESDLQFVGRLESADNLLPEARRVTPDIVLLDIEMPGPDAFEAADRLRRDCPDIRTIFLSAFVRDHYVSAAIRSGAWGYFAKSDDTSAIIDGIRQVARGEFAFGPAIQSRCRPAPTNGSRPEPPRSRLDALTDREQEVLRLIGRGRARTEIAKDLSRSPKTVDGHRESIMNKLDIHDRAELVRFAIREGLVEA